MKLVYLLCSTLLLAATSRANDINLRGPSADDDGGIASPKDISVLVGENHDKKTVQDAHLESPSTIDARELQALRVRRGGLFNPPKSSRLGLFNQQQMDEEVAAVTTTRTGNIFFAARSVTPSLLHLADASSSGYLLAFGPSMTNYNVICTSKDSGCDTMCPDACEVPRTAILRGLIWWNGVTDPDDPNLKKTEYEVKNDKDSVAKSPMTFEGNNQSGSSIWSFEVDLGSTSNSDVLPQGDWPNWEISVKQKIEDEDRNKLQTDRFDLITIDEAPPPLTSEPSDRPSSSPSREPSTEPTISKSPSTNPSGAPSFVPSGEKICVWVELPVI